MNATAVLLCAHGRELTIDTVADRGASLILRLGQLRTLLQRQGPMDRSTVEAFLDTEESAHAIVREAAQWTIPCDGCCNACPRDRAKAGVKLF